MKEVKKLLRKVSIRKSQISGQLVMFASPLRLRLSNFQPVEKFDRTLCSHGTVLFFCAVHTELSSCNISKQTSNNMTRKSMFAISGCYKVISAPLIYTLCNM